MNIDELTVKTLRRLGFKCLPLGKKNANGPDITAIKNGRAFTIELKKTKMTKRGSVQVPPVEPNRRNDDLIAIALPSGYVLVEPMDDHLKACTKSGYRTLTLLS